MHSVESSALRQVGYKEDERELYVRFIDSGETYVYFGVDPATYEALRAAESKGRYYSLHVRDAFPNERCT